MSDQVPASDAASASAAPVNAPATPANPQADATAPVTFGNNRGSGLARGKRPGNAASTSQKPAPSGDYKPSAIQVITPVREYTNPFAPETPAVSAAPAATNETSAAAPAPVEQPAAPATTEAPAPVANRPLDEVSTEKAELNILPPEPTVRPAQSWEHSDAPAASAAPAQEQRAERPERQERPDRGQRQERHNRHDRHERRDRPDAGQQPPADRPVFRTERQKGEFANRERQPRPEHGDRRPENRSFQPQPKAPVEEKKSGGLIGWLKGLFNSHSKVESPEEQSHTDQSIDANRRQHRGRGGRGQYRGDRQNRPSGQSGQGGNEGGPAPEGNREGGERRGEGGHNRRHHRGGRGRGGGGGGYRGPRNDRRGGPGGEGQNPAS